MSGLFGDGGKVVKPAPPKPAPPVPTPDLTVGEQAKKRRPRGRQETFLTGDLIPETGKKKVFG